MRCIAVALDYCAADTYIDLLKSALMEARRGKARLIVVARTCGGKHLLDMSKLGEINMDTPVRLYEDVSVEEAARAEGCTEITQQFQAEGT